jgi:hypothetical protein
MVDRFPPIAPLNPGLYSSCRQESIAIRLESGLVQRD